MEKAHIKITLGKLAKDCSVLADGKLLQVRKLTVKAQADHFTVVEAELIADEFELSDDLPITIYPRKDFAEAESDKRLQSMKV